MVILPASHLLLGSTITAPFRTAAKGRAGQAWDGTASTTIWQLDMASSTETVSPPSRRDPTTT